MAAFLCRNLLSDSATPNKPEIPAAKPRKADSIGLLLSDSPTTINGLEPRCKPLPSPNLLLSIKNLF